jgi:hypothetical protein
MGPVYDETPEGPKPVVATVTTSDFDFPEGKAPRIVVGYSPSFHYEPLLRGIFENAKSTDEFEFVCALLRVRACEDAGWDPFIESQRAVADFARLIDKQENVYSKARISLMAYCHITEISGVYEVLANLLMISVGLRFNMMPFRFLNESLSKKHRFSLPLSPSKKIRLLVLLSNRADFPSVSSMFGTFYNKEVRNAFFHSDYTLHGNEFRIVGKLLPKRVFTLDEVGVMVFEALSFYGAFFNLFYESAMSYTEEKIVKGRCGPNEEVEQVRILVHNGGGLKGFQTPP